MRLSRKLYCTSAFFLCFACSDHDRGALSEPSPLAISSSTHNAPIAANAHAATKAPVAKRRHAVTNSQTKNKVHIATRQRLEALRRALGPMLSRDPKRVRALYDKKGLAGGEFGGGFHHVMMAKLNPDGSVGQVCVENLEQAERVLKAPRIGRETR